MHTLLQRCGATCGGDRREGGRHTRSVCVCVGVGGCAITSRKAPSARGRRWHGRANHRPHDTSASAPRANEFIQHTALRYSELAIGFLLPSRRPAPSRARPSPSPPPPAATRSPGVRTAAPAAPPARVAVAPALRGPHPHPPTPTQARIRRVWVAQATGLRPAVVSLRADGALRATNLERGDRRASQNGLVSSSPHPKSRTLHDSQLWSKAV
jgi:hypothetical protein